MSNVTLVQASAQVRTFYFSGPPGNGAYSTAIVSNSLGRLKETIYSTFQVFVTSGAVGPAVTVVIEGTMDYLTGQGVSMPVVLTNGAATCTVPTSGYTLTVVDGNNAPTGQRTVSTNTAETFNAVTMDRTYAVYPNMSPPIQGQLSLVTGMTINGVLGIAPNTTITYNSPTSLTLSANFTGATGVYYATFCNNYWAKTALGTITLSGAATTYDSDQLSVISSMKYVRARVSVVTATTPTIQIWMGA
jgi:hypothetical protein